MKIDIVTIFPQMVESALAEGVVGRAREGGRLDIAVHNLRDFTTDRHHVVDDVPFGGGPGMVMKPEPFFAALEAIRERRGKPDAVVLMSPAGRLLTDRIARQMADVAHVVILCGRYEGIDERVREALASDEISIGDYVLSGGELAALVLVDAVARFVPGVVGDERSVAEDSFARGLLDYPQYTRPAECAGWRVPDVLLSGHHGDIRRWRRAEALRRTFERRPELLQDAALDAEEKRWLAEWSEAAGRAQDKNKRSSS